MSGIFPSISEKNKIRKCFYKIRKCFYNVLILPLGINIESYFCDFTNSKVTLKSEGVD